MVSQPWSYNDKNVWLGQPWSYNDDHGARTNKIFNMTPILQLWVGYMDSNSNCTVADLLIHIVDLGSDTVVFTKNGHEKIRRKHSFLENARREHKKQKPAAPCG